MTPSQRRLAQGARSAARLAAVQGLYQMDLAATDIADVLHDLTATKLRDAVRQDIDEAIELTHPDPVFLAELLRGVVRLQREIDPMIDNQLATGWRLVRVDSILRAILRSALFELMERSEVPARVVITEYIDVARAFLEGDDPRVVNGVLDKLARRIRPGEFNPAG